MGISTLAPPLTPFLFPKDAKLRVKVVNKVEEQKKVETAVEKIAEGNLKDSIILDIDMDKLGHTLNSYLNLQQSLYDCATGIQDIIFVLNLGENCEVNYNEY